MESQESEKKPKAMQVVPAEPVEEGYVVLPYNEGQFKDFIKSLLGSPQAITKTIYGTFEIDQNDIRNLYSLLYQRVIQQNEGVLAQFSAKIIYSDNSAIELNTIEEVMTYNEVRPIVSRAIHLKWDFVVRFQDKKIHEKQRIQVSFISTGASRKTIDDLSEPRTVYGYEYGIVTEGLINFRIEHTARTWGADIEALLTNHIESILIEPKKIKQIIRRYSEAISFGLGSIFFLAAVGGSLVAGKNFAASQAIKINNLLQSVTVTNIDTLNTKIDLLAKSLAGGAWSQFYFITVLFLLVSLVIAFIIGAWIDGTILSYDPSFILLTRQSQKAKEETLNRNRKSWRSFVVSIFVDLIVSVISNLIFVTFFAK